MKVVVRVPASSANIGSGVDTLGLALTLYTTVTFQRLPKGSALSVRLGRGMDADLSEEDNYVLVAARKLYEVMGLDFPSFDIHIETDIPFAHGLGSSSAALVAGLWGANAFLPSPLSEKELLQIATDIEGHPDNVVPAALGGFTAAMTDSEGVLYQSYRAPDLSYIAAVPSYRLSTSKARAVLPRELPLSTFIHQQQRACFLVNCLISREYEQLRRLTVDEVFTPSRRPLMPGSREVCDAAVKAGAYCAFTSGAGPTMLAMAPQKQGERDTRPLLIGAAMEQAYRELGIESEILYLRADNQGAVVTVLEDD
ncbi:MAG: homoserine kinase [Lachnospiraceae bacterium]|nr:homoserine kinase [Lachnospiraceae bacterium]